jgi:hypothetical protein
LGIIRQSDTSQIMVRRIDLVKRLAVSAQKWANFPHLGIHHGSSLA